MLVEGLRCCSFIAFQFRLTQTGGREHPSGHIRRKAVGEDRLQDVAGEGERDDSQRGGIHDEDGAPQQEEPGGRGGGRLGLLQVKTCLPAHIPLRVTIH